MLVNKLHGGKIENLKFSNLYGKHQMNITQYYTVNKSENEKGKGFIILFFSHWHFPRAGKKEV